MSSDSKPPVQMIGPTGIASEEAFGSPGVNVTVQLTGIESQAMVGTPTAWQMYSFAPEWFSDAVAEARSTAGRPALRREILFAVCAAEAYLIEWVRDDLLNHDFAALTSYFPSEGRRPGVRDRWKQVTAQLLTDNRIRSVPTWQSREWNDFVELVDYRDGLVHARSSRPDTTNVPRNERPFPSPAQLDSREAGWAVTVLVKFVEYVHRSIGTKPPDWLRVP